MNTTCPIPDLPAVTAQPRTAATLSRQFGRPSVVLALLACLLAGWLAPRAVAAPPEVTLTRLHSFGDPPTGPVMPAGRLLGGSDGMLYGATESGGQGHGTVFRMNKDGSGFIVLKSFANTEGSYPYAGVIEGSDGALYGTTYQGGGFGAGSAFRMKKDGTDFTVLKSFAAADGANPSAGLVEGGDGALYGTTEFGGDYGYGTVFRMNKDGTGFAVLKSFNNTDGARPLAAVTEGSDGALYSTTINGGVSGMGTVFRLGKDGSGFAVLKHFSLGEDGAAPTAGVIEGSDGALYGATLPGVYGFQGTVFRMNKDGSGFTFLKAISDSLTEGGRPYSGVIEGGDGALYGTTQGGGSLGGGTIFRLNRDGSGFAVLKHLDPTTEGADLYYGLTESSDGTLYGTGYQGGPSSGGTMFRLSKDGSGFTILKTLDNWTDGSDPEAGIIEASDGALYGTTFLGGDPGFGTVFRMKKDGTDFTVLKSFTPADGGWSSATLIESSDGMLYGTAYRGGDYDYGTVFRLHKDGRGFAVLKNFNNTEGSRPTAGVIEGSDGALYGTTINGGEPGSNGTVFRMNKDGTGFAVLKFFGPGADGWAPIAGVIEGSDGALYGATQGGLPGSQGSVFRMNKDGSGFMVIKTFSNGLTEGGRLYSGVIEGSDGALYGTTQGGGSLGGGTIFRLDRDGSGFAVLKHMDPATEGADLYYALTEHSDGALYGTAFVGGPSGCGSIFRINKDGSGFAVLSSPGAAEGEPRNFTCKLLHSSDGRWYGTTYLGGTANLGTIFAFQLDTHNPPPTLESLTPASAFANGSAFNLAIAGTGFLPGAVVHWNGSARPTTVVSSGVLTAAIPASDLLTGVDIAVASVQVVNGDGQVSNPLGFSIIAQTVGTADAAVTPPGGTSTVSTAPATSGEPGVTVTVQNGGDAPVTVLAATYDTRPVGETVFQVDSGSFVDVQIAGANSLTSATVFFYYPSTTSGGRENRVRLRWFDGANPMEVFSSRRLPNGSLSPTNMPPVQDERENLDGTVSGGRFTVVFDDTSTPTIMELTGTVFGMFESQPQLGAITGPTGPVALGETISLTANFAVVGDPADALVRFLWDDGTESTVAPTTPTSATASHHYAAPGVYGVTVEVTDGQGDMRSGRFEYVVIYDPNGGFVTGGGWIESAPGAYLYDATLTDKATFGFNSKYLKGQSVPSGQTQFQFQAGDFKFQSTAYEWLVVAGAKAQYKGVGQVNGAGDYGFLLTATDGQINGGGGADRFRIKVWDRATGTVVYDNRRGASDDLDTADPQALGGGSITIQKGK